MPRTSPPPTHLRQALDRVVRDTDYRAHVLEDGDAAQVEARLPEADWQQLLAAALTLDAERRFDPTQPTELDHGEADAAGVKG
jgi:hypothetical protein